MLGKEPLFVLDRCERYDQESNGPELGNLPWLLPERFIILRDFVTLPPTRACFPTLGPQTKAYSGTHPGFSVAEIPTFHGAVSLLYQDDKDGQPQNSVY